MDDRVEEIRERVTRWISAKTPKGALPSAEEIEALHDVKDHAPEDMPYLLDRLQAAEERVEELERTFLHYHKAGEESLDRCERCGLNIRDRVHRRREALRE